MFTTERPHPGCEQRPLDWDYWLRHCHGFLVDSLEGEELGVVEDVRIDPQLGGIVSLEVAGGWFGRRRCLLAVTDVLAVEPGARRLLARAS